MVEIESFIAYGNKAPSSHNAKMWTYRVDDVAKNIQIKINDSATLPKVDPNNRETWISLGAFVQNIILVAKNKGYKVKYSFSENTIILSFSDVIKPKIFDKDLILQRHTTRKSFSKDNIDDVIVQLKERYKKIIYLKQGEEEFHEIVELSKAANTQQINNLSKREELAEWINFDKDKNKGLNLKNLGMNTFERLIFRYLVGEKGFKNNSFIKKQYIKQSGKLYDACAGYLLIDSNKNSLIDWFESGLLLEKIWIDLTKENISVHPMSQVIEEEPFYSKAKKILSINNEIQMLLRIGRKNKTQCN